MTKEEKIQEVYGEYSEEWKKEMKKLPKDVIIEITSTMGKEKQAEIDNLKRLNYELYVALTEMIALTDTHQVPK